MPKNLGTISDPKDIVTKEYVDNALQNVSGGQYTELAFEGTYNASTNKIVTRSYVDTNVCDYITICDITTTEEVSSIVQDIDLTPYDQLLVDINIMGTTTNRSQGNVCFTLRNDAKSDGSIEDSHTWFVPTTAIPKSYSAIFMLNANKVQGLSIVSTNTYGECLQSTKPLSFYTKAQFYTTNTSVLGVGTKFRLIGVKYNAHS